jgi:tryptophan-rich sensory protein
MKTALNQWLALAIFIAMSFAAAFIGGLFTSSSVGTWYTTLNKPSWTPPSWLFGPVWTALYFSMAVAAWLVWRTHEVKAAKVALALFVIQLVLNAAWSGFFFGMRNPGLAFAEIILLWGAILATMLAFWRMKPLAGLLFAPYLLWVTFAAALNFAIWRLNA